MRQAMALPEILARRPRQRLPPGIGEIQIVGVAAVKDPRSRAQLPGRASWRSSRR